MKQVEIRDGKPFVKEGKRWRPAIERLCIRCGNPFYSSIYITENNKRMYCGNECKLKALNSRRIVRQVRKECRECKTPFLVPHRHHKRYVHCSKKCLTKYRKRQAYKLLATTRFGNHMSRVKGSSGKFIKV